MFVFVCACMRESECVCLRACMRACVREVKNVCRFLGEFGPSAIGRHTATVKRDLTLK